MLADPAFSFTGLFDGTFFIVIWPLIRKSLVLWLNDREYKPWTMWVNVQTSI